MTATREDNKTLILYMTYNSLIVPDPGIRFPAMVSARLLYRETFLEVGYALDLPCHQHRTIQQERRSLLFDYIDAFAVEISMAGWRHVDFDAGWKDNPSLAPDIGMQHERHLAPANTPEYTFESTMMIGVSMRENDGTQSIRMYFEYVHIVKHGVASKPGIVEHGCGMTVALDGQEQRIAMFREQLLAFAPVVGKRCSLRYLCTRHEYIERIVHQYRDICRVNR